VKNVAIGITAAVFSNVFSKMPEASLNAKYAATARRLGPGIDRHHVKRAVRTVCKVAKRQGNEGLLLNRPGFTGGQNSRRIARYGTDIKEEDLEAVFT
jgi:hypothetical protein